MVIGSQAKGFSLSNGDSAERPQLFLAGNNKANAELTGRRPRFTLATYRDIARFLVDQMNPMIWELSKAGSSGDVKIGLYSRDRTLSLLRQVRGLAQLLEITAKMKLPRL
jgi:hypothetical protein